MVDALRSDGFDVASFRPQRLTEVDVRAATRVVAIGVDLGTLGARAGPRLESWTDIPPMSTGYPASRDALAARIRALLDGLGLEKGR